MTPVWNSGISFDLYQYFWVPSRSLFLSPLVMFVVRIFNFSLISLHGVQISAYIPVCTFGYEFKFSFMCPSFVLHAWLLML